MHNDHEIILEIGNGRHALTIVCHADHNNPNRACATYDPSNPCTVVELLEAESWDQLIHLEGPDLRLPLPIAITGIDLRLSRPITIAPTRQAPTSPHVAFTAGTHTIIDPPPDPPPNAHTGTNPGASAR